MSNNGVMDSSLREIFESMTFSFNRNSSYVRNVANLSEVERLATLANSRAMLDLYTKKARLSDAKRHQLLAPIRAERIELMVALEQRYGDGHFGERRKCLDDLLEDLAQNYHVDLKALLAVLREGYRGRERKSQVGREVDARRAFARHGRIVKNIRELLLKLQKSYEALLTLYGTGFVMVDELAGVEARLNLRQKLDSLRTELEHDPLAHEEFPGPYRRSRTGKPDAPWRKRLRTQLKAVGVPDELEESLLISTGLLPYRPLPSVVD